MPKWKALLLVSCFVAISYSTTTLIRFHRATESRSQKRILLEHILKYTSHNETMLALRYFQKKKAIKQWGTYLRSPTAFACVCHDEVTTLFSINRKHCWAFSLNEHNKRCWCHQFNTAKHSSQFRETDSSLGKAMYRLLLLMCTHRSTLGDNFGTKWWIVIFACWDNWHWPYIKAAQEWWQNLRQCEINSKFVSDWPYKRARVLFTKRTDDASQLDYWIFFSYKFSGRKAKKNMTVLSVFPSTIFC